MVSAIAPVVMLLRTGVTSTGDRPAALDPGQRCSGPWPACGHGNGPAGGVVRRLADGRSCGRLPARAGLHVGNRLDGGVLVPYLMGMGTACVCPYADPGVRLPAGVFHPRRFADLPDELERCA
jgi:hypothetical protein